MIENIFYSINSKFLFQPCIRGNSTTFTHNISRKIILFTHNNGTGMSESSMHAYRCGWARFANFIRIIGLLCRTRAFIRFCLCSRRVHPFLLDVAYRTVGIGSIFHVASSDKRLPRTTSQSACHTHTARWGSLLWYFRVESFKLFSSRYIVCLLCFECQ